MTQYEQYVTAVNKVFECINHMKKAWSDQDNINFIENIEVHKQQLIDKATIFSSGSSVSSTEELNND